MNPTNEDSGSAADADQIQQWMDEFDVTEAQVKEAVAAVGTKTADIELHLKGSRSSSNSDKVRDVG